MQDRAESCSAACGFGPKQSRRQDFAAVVDANLDGKRVLCCRGTIHAGSSGTPTSPFRASSSTRSMENISEYGGRGLAAIAWSTRNAYWRRVADSVARAIIRTCRDQHGMKPRPRTDRKQLVAQSRPAVPAWEPVRRGCTWCL
jgi:hypothetical protein